MTSYPLTWFGSGRGCRLGTVVAILTCLACGPATQVQAQNNTQRGATLGGLTGAIAGAIIGENSDKAGAGAAIGGAVGIVAGGLLGNANDKDVAYRNQQYAQQRQYQVQQQMTATTYAPQQVPTGAVSYSDVIAMSRSGVSQNVILNQISTRGVQRQPAVSDIISLHEQGVSETVISAMQQAPLGSQIAGANAVPTTTIVETPVYVTPPPQPIHVHHRHYGPVYRARPRYYGH
ncbi:glycine zipper domain-containing protein [Allorhodopirellula heiligendammensis]|uniref:Glycine zipper domain-containing protein n=1 Tax=Allorhodopirellula heiligendammensis TaxID=2714739 RepID=A0A5C6BE04_9BACT|nr:glycine zipper domain-containing protein [Allorhodopirellula heiligendammensis]TWU10425.1 hypothetical protein Poly21_43290 [Allorhodopirellula heiligendammensis]